jgi:DNA adenine methylase
MSSEIPSAAEPASQYSLFGGVSLAEPVNVAKVTHRSPFRYPGGKTWLVPRVRQWLRSLPERPRHFIEPFAGGAIVGLTVAFERLAERVTIVELDEDVAAVWKAIFGGEGEWLASRIESFAFSPEAVDEALSDAPSSTREHAFQTVLRNRVNRGGILAPGAGRIKTGENGRGMASRWYPATLAKRIRAIATVEQRIDFVHGDGLEVMRAHAEHEGTATFIDPPYTAAGKRAGRRLYRYSELDHEALFEAASAMRGDVLLTYDNEVGAQELAARHGLVTEPIAMKSTHHAKMTELLIGRDLGWLR